MKIIISALFSVGLWITPIHAAEEKPADNTAPGEIHIFNDQIAPSDVEHPGFRVITPAQRAENEKKESAEGDRLPEVQRRDSVFRDVGLDGDIQSWDQLDKDLLWIRARNKTLNLLAKDYPKLKREKLDRLISTVQSTSPAPKADHP